MAESVSSNQVNVKNVVLASPTGRVADLTYLFTEITMRESWSNSVITGTVTIVDDHDHYEILPIIGQEFLSIKVEMYGDIYTLPFRVYKVGDVRRLDGRRSQYTLHFVSLEMLTNEKQRVSKAYANTKYSDMVRDLLETEIGTSKTVAVTETLNTMTHIVPNVRPFNAINQIIQKAVSAKGESNYIFYEDRRGFIVVPLSELTRQDTKYTYTYRESPRANELPFKDPFVIYNIRFTTQSDVLNLTNEGLFGTQLHSIDLLQRKVDIYEYEYQTLYDELDHLNRESLYFDSEESDVEGQQYFTYSSETAGDNSYITSNDSGFTPDQSSVFRAKRRLQSLMFSSYISEIEIMGNPLLFVGDVIDVKYTSNAIQTELRQHRMFSGRAMVASITHLMTAGREYAQRVELVKDSVIENLGDEI